ncbi:hypothetical protein CYMTET_55330 [Cymbomonas tetramitiformis]|uniref:ribonuclease H n=1 Tax=Cymbomonas tetramitiformis TaxID=36881 RepID=A0AAE0BD52_9CHLO|nr:hypothetical protein CYMTET_55330 [Cymbomonas tetramitiformis]
MENISDWPAQIKALHEAGNSLKDILHLLSMYPLANQTKHFEQADVEWTEQAKEVLGIETNQEKEEDDVMTTRNPRGRIKRKTEQRDRGQWSTQEDRMDTLGQEGTYTPARILASRQYLQNYTDATSKVTQYEIRWTNSEGREQTTWSTEETVRTHLLKHNSSSDHGWRNLVEEWENDKRDKRAKREPVEEILAGQPNGEQRYWKHVTHLEICTKETNPDQDIRHIPGTKDRQLRTEGDTTYCYEPDGGLIGTLSTVKVRELYDRYAEAVGDSMAQRPTGKQLAKRLKLSIEHKIHVNTFEEEIAQLLIRYSSKAEMKHRKRNLQNHWTFPPEMMEAVHTAMGVQTEVFASPLNVHKNTKMYYSQYPRDSVFGAVGSAWEEQWEKLGSYQFNPEYTAGDLYKALKKAINSTKTAEPVLGVGIYPTYAKSPYRKLLNKHMGYRVHELLEIKEGQFTFLPPDHWMQGNLQKPKQCNWNMRILIVANAAGWRKYCPDALKTHDIFSKALFKCPQSKVRTIGRACYMHRPLTLRDADRRPRSITEWEKDCVIDPAPWTNHELPVMRAMPSEHLENHTEEIVDRWMEDRKKEGEHRGGDRGPRPTTMDVLRANTTWSREEINKDALRRWALQFTGPDTTEEDINMDQWLQWERGEIEKAELPPESRWDNHGKGYPEPHRRHNKNDMVYTDGSQRKVKKENGEVEEVTAAGVWDPRGGRAASHMQRWTGRCQTVNRAELTAIYMALTLDSNSGKEKVSICTDSLTSLYQIQNMKRRPHMLERHVHRDILWKIMKQIQTLNREGTKVALYKVKAHVGIHGNEMADEVAKKACEEGEYSLNHDNTDTVMLLAICEATGRQLEGHQAILNHVTKKVREAKMTGETNIIQRLKRKLETGPEEWETKRQRIERMEAEYAQKSREPTEIEIVEAWADTWPDEPEWQREQEEELELQWMERQEEEALIQGQQVQTVQQAKQKRGHRQESTREVELSKDEAGETRTILKEEALGQGKRQKRRRTRSQTGPDQLARREVEGQREVQGEAARVPTQELKLPEAQNKGMTTQQDNAAELSEMAQQQEEAQEEWRALQEMAQQQEAAQKEAYQAKEWRRTSIEKILTATREKPEKYMQHLKGDKAMHKLSNEYWKKGTEYLNEHDVTVLLRCRANKLPAGPYKKQQGGGRAQKCKCCGMPRQVNAGGFIRTAHVLGGCTEREIKNMVISRSDETTKIIAKAISKGRKGGCVIRTHAGKKGKGMNNGRPIEDFLLTRGQCRLDGRNTPAPEHGKDTIPHYVDIVMLEGTEKGNEQPGYTHQKAMAEAGHIHLIEVTYTDEMSWEEALKTKYTKYTPLVKLLELYGYKVTLHVMVFGNTGTIYEHTEKILTKHLGFDKQEALHLLRKVHDLATGYAVSLNRLYRKKVDKEPD